jgi:hypothetical protein
MKTSSQLEKFSRQIRKEKNTFLFVSTIFAVTLLCGYLWGKVVFSFPEPIPFVAFAIIPAIIMYIGSFSAHQFTCPCCEKPFYGRYRSYFFLYKNCLNCKISKYTKELHE